MVQHASAAAGRRPCSAATDGPLRSRGSLVSGPRRTLLLGNMTKGPQ
jgi:hypothetical protein